MMSKLAHEQESRAVESESGGRRDPAGPPREAPASGAAALDRSNPDFLAHAYDTYAEMRAQGPVVRARYVPLFISTPEQDAKRRAGGELATSELFFVSQYDAAAAALVDGRLSSVPDALLTPEQREKQPPMPERFRPIMHSLLLRDPPDHTRLRKLVQPSFSNRAMEALVPRIQKLADDLLDKAVQGASARGESSPERRMKLIEEFAYPLPVAVISDMLGIPPADRQTVQEWSSTYLDKFENEETGVQTRGTTGAFRSYFDELFERKRRDPGDDMISQMVHAQEDGDTLSEDELFSMVFILYFAGHVTTVNLIGNGVVALLTHPGELARFKANPALARGVVEETLRYWGPVDFPGSVRTAREDLEIAGTSIPKGAQVGIGLSSANRDPSRFVHPDKYDISRPDAQRHIAFGKGIHLCIGAPLARIEGQIAFETLFRRFPDLRLATQDRELTWNGAAGLRGFREVPVSF
jgi:cytochrome P450